MSETVGPPQARQGMSKGCLISMIVVGIIIVLIIAAGLVCYIYREDIVKAGTVTTLNAIKGQVDKEPPPGVDTAQFNAMTQDFITRLNADTAKVDMMKFQALMTTIRTVMDDKMVDSAEVKTLEMAMFRYYPELGDEYNLGPQYESGQSDSTKDTTADTTAH